MDIVIKSQETREGARFRILKDNKFFFADLKFKNYFYILTNDYDMLESEINKKFSFCIDKVEIFSKYTRIYLSNNFMRTKIKDYLDENCQTFEADIKANKRFLLDRNIDLNNEKIPYLFYDIETDDRLPMQKDDKGAVIANSRILSFSGVNQDGKIYSLVLENEDDESEKKLLNDIMTIFSNYGILSGWYSDKFDKPFIEQRCQKYNISIVLLEYINHIDYKELYKKYDKKSLKSYSLNNVSNIELRESKIDQEKGNGKIFLAWKENREHLLKYNIEDSNLIYKINRKLMFIEVSMKRANNAGCHIQNTMNNSDSGDYLLLRQCREDCKVMVSKPTKKEVELRKLKGKIGGGYTTCFEPGFWPEVNVWDFKSLYPSIIETWNISPDTYVDTMHREEDALKVDKEKYLVTPADFEGYYHPHRIFLKEVGIIPKVVKKLVDKRDVIKYSMEQYKKSEPDKYKALYLEQYALKTDANSIYGILSFPVSRWYMWDCGDAVTTCARATIKECYNKLKDWGCTVLGGDTDSTFAVLNGQDYKDIDKKFVEFLKEYGDRYYVRVNKLVFEHEKVFKPMLFVMKKNYAYKIDDVITIKGMESIKSDTNALASKLQREFVEQVLNGLVVEDDWKIIIEKYKNKVFNQQLETEELITVKALTKMPKDYEGYVIDKKTRKPKIKADGTLQEKSIPAHVKLAERMIKQGIELYPGSKIRYIVISEKPNLAISPEEYKLGKGIFEHKHKKFGLYNYEFSGEYCSQYYWLRILKPLMKVMYAYWKKIPDWDWNLSKSQMKKMIVEEEEE